MKWFHSLVLLFLMGAQCGSSPETANSNGYKTLAVSVKASYPHDKEAFTQGLVVKDGYFYESTGLYGKSTLRKVTIGTGAVVKKFDLPQEVFAEGLARVGEQWLQLTWQNKVGFAYSEDGNGFVPDPKPFPVSTEGWGLAFRPGQLLLSDGSDTLFDLDLQTKEIRNKIPVHGPDGPVRNLNELEFVGNWLLANVWQSNYIVVINPDTGEVKARLEIIPDKVLDAADAKALRPGEDVLNGIAYDETTKKLYVTGKNWPKVLEIEVPELASLPTR